MKKINFYCLLFIILFIQGCIEAPKSSRKSTSSSSTTTTTTTTTPTFATDEKVYWFSATKTVGTITINKNNSNTYYLRGSSIHNFLSSKNTSGVYYYSKQYCLVGSFSSSSNKQFRLRAVPATTTNNKAVERIFRIDFSVEDDNKDTCYKSTVDNVAYADAVYLLKDICTSCTGKITTSTLKIVINNSNILESINSSVLSLGSTLLQVDLDSSSTTDATSCTNSACSAKGFDCCVEGQCVMDGSYKTGYQSSPDYTTAIAEYAKNPLTFINYPTVYNICANIAHNPVSTGSSSSTDTAKSLATAAERVAAYKDYWICLDTVANKSDYTSCNYQTYSNADSYTQIKYKLAQNCGCTADISTFEAKCANWSVKPIYKNALVSNDNIVDFYCYTPVVDSMVGSITNLNVSVSTRSAPHRYFSVHGDSYDTISGLSTIIASQPSAEADLKQEGDDFYYQDENTKTGPQNGEYNINSVLGKMTVDLTKSAPAKTVSVELGKTYILTTTKGYLTACPLCAADSWYSSFFAHPNSQLGTGLQFSGYSTSRNAFSNNENLGNYEDTHFGRACYLPVTMIPYSHQKNSDLTTQRQDRLKTQAAFFINGYQKDWYGFNQGAMIGSFDGVTWFGVGKGRRITATSSKLFLAINAPYLDLSAKSDMIVNIIPDVSTNTAANVDYDPELDLKSPYQGTAATCQKFHQCSKDSDCVAQLGWEYTCADVGQMKTTWPVFDGNGNEKKGQELNTTIFDLLTNTISTTNSKRCVYRGAGAPCKRDVSYFDNNTSTNSSFKKLLTCAPNFYCASMNATAFNSEIVRSPNEYDSINFGMDTNVLGRPLNYVTSAKPLPESFISNYKHVGETSLGLSTAASDLGMCMPGKSIVTSYSESNVLTAHGNADSNKRTDYISQIGSCDATATGNSRVLSCPTFDANGNYSDYSVDPTKLALQQNMCGGEAKNSSTSISAFKTIEGGSLNSLNSISTQILAQDACLRKAGSVCHTDLDCGPNSMHESIAANISLSFFGGTEAERSYWTESLICGQMDAVPLKSDSKYLKYDLTQNKCCREIGKDFTMYTKGSSTYITDQTTTGASTLDTTNFSVSNPSASNRYSRYSIAPSAYKYYDPITDSYLENKNLVPQIPTSGTITEPGQKQWTVINETGSNTCCGGGWIRKFADGTHTWPIKDRLKIDTSNFSCLNFRSPLASSTYQTSNPTLFYSGSNLPTSGGTSRYSSVAISKESGLLCKSPFEGGCIQIPYKDNSNFQIEPPSVYLPAENITEDTEVEDSSIYEDLATNAPFYTRMDMSPTDDPTTTQNYTEKMNVDAPYTPIVFYHPRRIDEYKNVPFTFLWSQTIGYSTHFYLPAYMGWDGTLSNSTYIRNIYIKYFYDSSTGTKPKLQNITGLVNMTAANCTNAVSKSNTTYGASGDYLTAGGDTASWCITANADTGYRPVIIIRGDTDSASSYNGWKYAGIIIDFKPIEYASGSYSAPESKTKTAIPGNAQYYLSKLSRLELLGIPQITYEPIYCSNNHDNLVPGIFKTTTATALKTRSNFSTNGLNYSASFDPLEIYNNDGSVSVTENFYTYSNGSGNFGNREKKFVYENKVDHDPVFSSKDFTCCTPLGKNPKNGSANCCSGYAETKNGVSTCKLPSGTDLNVYFNKFVSNEGVGSEQPGGGLIAAHVTDTDNDGTEDLDAATAEDNIDFNQYTGEPKYRDSTFKKIYTLGTSYCASGSVVYGGAFGQFAPEPYSGTYSGSNSSSSSESSYPVSIVDTILDSDPNDSANGKSPFDQGFRWNNHYYCK